MARRPAAGLESAVARAIAAAAPGLVVLAGLAASGILGLRWAVVLAVADLLATLLVVGRWSFAIAALGNAVDDISAEQMRGLSLGRSRDPGNIRLAIQRLARIWRERTEAAEARITAAETVIASVPDPLICSMITARSFALILQPRRCSVSPPCLAISPRRCAIRRC